MMKKEENIETLRGVAIILMVLGHVVGGDSTKGLKVHSDSFYYYLFYVFEYIRMPLFTVISGYIYAIKPVSKDNSLWKFILRKIQRLIVPCLIASTLFFVVQFLTPGTNSNVDFSNFFSKIFFESYVHFWFAQGIFFVFIFIAIIDYYNIIQNNISWLVVLGFVAIIYLNFNIGSSFLSSDKWPFLALFFLWGVGIKRLSLKFQVYAFLKFPTLLIFMTLFIFQQYIFFDKSIILDGYNLEKLFTVIIGLSSSMLLLNLNFINKGLINIGNYSYEIYLYHVFGTAGARIILYKMGFTNLFWNLVIGLLLGIVFPIILKKLITNYRILDSLIFGQRYKTTLNFNPKSIDKNIKL